MATTVLVEGESDRIAVETLARREGHDLEAGQAAVVPMGGATSIGRCLTRHGEDRLLAPCDRAESAYVARAIDRARPGSEVRFELCDADLEDELIRALGTDAVLDVIAAEGELASFRLLQRQPAQRDRPLVPLTAAQDATSRTGRDLCGWFRAMRL